MPDVVKRVIIVGGGIGGLCTAIGLRQVGVEAIVYEQAEVLSQVGAGLTIWANAIKALRKLGLADAVIGAGSSAPQAGGHFPGLSPASSNDSSASRQLPFTAQTCTTSYFPPFPPIPSG